MKIQDIVLLIVSFVFLTTPARSENSPWPMFRHDERHTGRTQFTGPAIPVVAWEYNVGDEIGSSPVIGHDGTVYFGSGTKPPDAPEEKYFYALKPDGTLKWKLPIPYGIFSSAAVGPDGTVYVGAFDYNLYAIRDLDSSADVLWKTNLGFTIYSSPTIGPDGTIYIGCLSFDVWGINPDGTSRWQYTTGWCVFSSPALSPDGTVYIGSKDEHLYAFREDGSKVWATATGTFYDGYLVDSSPAIGEDGTIYVGTDPYGAAGQLPVPVDKVFYAFRPDGTIKWYYPMNDGAESSPAIGSDGTIYVGSYDGNIYALEDNGDSATLKWSFKTEGAVDGSPAVDGRGVIYIGSRDGYLYALNPDGTLHWKYLADGAIESSPAIDDSGRLYFGTFHGTLYCIGEEGPFVIHSPYSVPQQEFMLYSCYPNPFNESTTITFSIPRQNHDTGGYGVRTRISVYDLTGRIVKTVLDDKRRAGIYTIWWNGLDDNGNRIPSGVYLVSLSAGNVRKNTEIALMK